MIMTICPCIYKWVIQQPPHSCSTPPVEVFHQQTTLYIFITQQISTRAMLTGIKLCLVLILISQQLMLSADAKRKKITTKSLNRELNALKSTMANLEINMNKQLINLTSGPAGLPGPQGPIGPPGPVGSQGTQGEEGPQGKTGSYGAVGPQGPIGPPGTGASSSGNGLTQEVDELKTLVLALQTDLSDVQTELQEINKTGLAGPPGPQVPRGIPGTVGYRGDTGPQGSTGSPGANGIPGPVGPQGVEGPQGETGSDGAVGPHGFSGPVGPQGPIGLEGPHGPIGPEGPHGTIGPVGPQGPIGPEGQQGVQGVEGPQGEAGSDGAVGPHGPIGPPGPVGTPTPVAFSAGLTYNKNCGNDIGGIVGFDHVFLNEGNGYNNGVFTCPKTGGYMFTVSLMNNVIYSARVILKLDGGELVRIYSGKDDNYQYQVGSNTVIVPCKEGSQVYVVCSEGTLDGGNSYFTIFSGIQVS